MVTNQPAANYAIREFSSGDQEVARQIIIDGLCEHFQEFDESLNQDVEDISTYYSDQGHRFHVVEAESEIIGTGCLMVINPLEGRIVRMSVAPEHRGRGIGREMTAHLIMVATEIGLERVHVETNLDWYPAISLYKRCGFVELFTDEVSVHMIYEIIAQHREKPS